MSKCYWFKNENKMCDKHEIVITTEHCKICPSYIAPVNKESIERFTYFIDELRKSKK